MDTFVGTPPGAARYQANATGIILAGLFEESRVKRRVLPGDVYFINNRSAGNLV